MEKLIVVMLLILLFPIESYALDREPGWFLLPFDQVDGTASLDFSQSPSRGQMLIGVFLPNNIALEYGSSLNVWATHDFEDLTGFSGDATEDSGGNTFRVRKEDSHLRDISILFPN